MFVYKQYDQAALDRQYNNRLHVPEFATCIDRWKSLSRQTEKQFPVVKNIAYGQMTRETLDIYPSPQPFSKTLVFIHGGYWQKFDKDDFQFIANAFRPGRIVYKQTLKRCLSCLARDGHFSCFFQATKNDLIKFRM